MISPVDIQNKQFKKAKIGGYSIEEVNEFLDEVINDYQEIINENYALKDKINGLNDSVQYYRSMEATIQNVLVMADKTAQDTKNEAYEKADEIKKDAETKSDKLVGLAEERVNKIVDKGRQEAFEITKKVEEVKRQYLSYKAQFKQLLQSQVELLEQGDACATIAQDDMLKSLDIDNITKEDVNLDTEHSVDSLEDLKNLQELSYTREYTPISDQEMGILLGEANSNS